MSQLTAMPTSPVDAADQLDELGIDDLISVMAHVSEQARAEVLAVAAKVAADRRARPGAVCDLCGSISHLTPQCGLAVGMGRWL